MPFLPPNQQRQSTEGTTADNDNKYEISAEKYGSIYWTQTLFIY